MNRIIALWQTAVGKKVAMAVTGLALVLFLISHMISNVLVFENPQHLDDYGAWLRSFGPLLWVARLGLLAAVSIHIAAAWQLTRMARAARPADYNRHELRVSSYAARTMRWGGVLLLAFIVFHIFHLTLGTLHPDFVEGAVSRNLKSGLAVKPVAAFYALAMIFLGLHLGHGIWSVFQTLGLNHPAWNASRKVIAVTLAVLVAGGLLSIPVAALLGLL
ncbi:MAG: succinate dehydrogenase cytochrome b subunit [Gemmatimonadales bacterium]